MNTDEHRYWEKENICVHLWFARSSHNTIRGAAGAAILNAELMKTQGYLV